MAINTEFGFKLLENLNLTDFWLPFIIIFVVVFAALQKSGILGKDNKKFNVIIALALGLIVTIPHVLGKYPVGKDPITIINTAVPNVAIILVAIVMVLILIGMFGGASKFGGGFLGGIIALVAFAFVIYIFVDAAGLLKGTSIGMPSFLRDPATQSVIVIVLIFGIIVYFITKEDSTSTSGGGVMKFFEKIGDWFKP